MGGRNISSGDIRDWGAKNAKCVAINKNVQKTRRISHLHFGYIYDKMFVTQDSSAHKTATDNLPHAPCS